MFPYIKNTANSLYQSIESLPNAIAQSVTTANIGLLDLIIPVIDAAVFPNSRFIVIIESELIIVSGVSGNNLIVEQRGASTSIAASHISNSVVTNVWTALQSNTLRDAILAIENFVQFQQSPVLSIELDSNNITPTNGDRYLIRGVGVNDFAGNDNTIAHYNNQWYFIQPFSGFRITSLADNVEYYFNGVLWQLTQNSVNRLKWVDLVSTWTIEPTSIPYSNSDGEVLQYTYGSTIYYRFVPNPYNSALDTFYTTYSNPTLSGLITTRASSI